MRKALTALCLVAALAFTSALALAADSGNRTFVAKLTGANEVPQVNTDAKGTAQIRINRRKQTVCWSIHVKDLTSTATAAHIHGPAATNATAGIRVTLGTPSGGKKNARSKGCRTAGQGDLTLADITDILANPATFYVNVHTLMHGGGEVRGHLKRS